VFAGYGALTVSMAAESAPRERMADAIGTVQVAQRLGPAIGPIIGGLVAPIFGLRQTFLIAAGFYLAAVILIAVFYREPRTRQARSARRSLRAVFFDLVGTPGFVMVFVVILCLQLVDRSFGPILPLYVELLGWPAPQVPLVSGILFSIAAIFAAVGHKIAGPLLHGRAPRVLIASSSAATAAGLLVLLVAPSVWALALALAAAGLAIGVGMTAAYTMGGALLPPDAHATGFGLLTTASLIGLAVSPIVAGFISGPGLRVVFEADIAMLVLLTGVVWMWMTPGAAVPPPSRSGPGAS
jgi:MFS family permease